MTSVSAGQIILTPTQPVGSWRPQRESDPGPPHKESRALPTELPRPPPPPGREIEREKQRETERDRQTDIETDRDRQTDRHRQSELERKGEIEVGEWKGGGDKLIFIKTERETGK